MAFTFEGRDKSGVSLPSISVILALSLVHRGLTKPRHSGKANAKVGTHQSFDNDQGKPRVIIVQPSPASLNMSILITSTA